jgi:hypothetical protein
LEEQHKLPRSTPQRIDQTVDASAWLNMLLQRSGAGVSGKCKCKDNLNYAANFFRDGKSTSWSTRTQTALTILGVIARRQLGQV